MREVVRALMRGFWRVFMSPYLWTGWCVFWAAYDFNLGEIFVGLIQVVALPVLWGLHLWTRRQRARLADRDRNVPGGREADPRSTFGVKEEGDPT